MEADSGWLAVPVTVIVIVASLFFYVYNLYYAIPSRLRSILLKRGISGPSPSFLLGNIPQIKTIRLQHHKIDHATPTISHHWPSSILPHLLHWLRQYGQYPISALFFSFLFFFWAEKDPPVQLAQSNSMPCTSFYFLKPRMLFRWIRFGLLSIFNKFRIIIPIRTNICVFNR